MKKLLIVLLCLSLAGCATILKKKSVDVAVNTQPEGANVFVNGSRAGRTPVTINLSHKYPVTLTFSKEGYEEMSHRIDNHMVVGWLLVSFLCDVYPGFIDLITGDTYSLNENKVMVKLDPIESK